MQRVWCAFLLGDCSTREQLLLRSPGGVEARDVCLTTSEHICKPRRVGVCGYCDERARNGGGGEGGGDNYVLEINKNGGKNRKREKREAKKISKGETI